MYSTLAVNSILYSVAINELEGSGGATAFDSMSRTLAEFSGGETQRDLTLGESQISNLTFGILQSMVKTWLLDKVQQYYVDITAILAIDSWNTIKEISQGVQELREDSTAQKVREKAEERQKFLRWMSPISCDDKHATCRSQRNPGTGRWIFRTDKYMAWNTSEHAFLWLNGQPRHGKTILDSSVIDETQDSCEAEPQTLGFFYCNFRDDRTTSAAAVLRSLVVQLLQQSRDDWITKIREPWQRRDGKLHLTNLHYLRKFLIEASALVCRPVLVIYALDECKDYSDLVGHLVNLAKDARLRLFVTSRSEPEIQDVFYDLPTLSLKDSAEQMKADICAHITEQLKNQKRLSRLPDALKTTILEKLLEKAEGIPDSILKALDDLPAGLYETYDRIIHSIKERGKDDFPIARRFLLFLAGAFTPLTLDKLNEAMMIEVRQSSLNEDLGVMDTTDIVAACRSLVTYNEKTGIVALSHYSVKEYLSWHCALTSIHPAWTRKAVDG
ncbi:hypothetical protein BD769DRAFT_1667570 [Suillus cothurnatus]|nr:hypothetical protein BD769DRAFT_1667570 [Suillus cothurnatus]